MGAEPGVNHSYLREDDWNLWFVATAPSDADLAASLARIEAASGLAVLSLPLERPFNIDLGFGLRGPRAAMILDRQADMTALRDDDRPLMQALSGGLALVPRPFAELAGALNRSEADVIARIGALSAARIRSGSGWISSRANSRQRSRSPSGTPTSWATPSPAPRRWPSWTAPAPCPNWRARPTRSCFPPGASSSTAP